MEPGTPQPPPEPPTPPPDDDFQAATEALFRKTPQSRRPGCLPRGGCGMGCLGATLVIMFGISAFLAWLLAEARIPAAEGLVGPESVAFSIVHLNEEDPGVRALLQTTMTDLRTAFIDRSTLPPPVKETLRRLAPQNVKSFLPLQMVVTYDVIGRPVNTASSAPAKDDDAPVYTCVVSFGRFRGLSDVMYRSIVSAKEDGSSLITHRGYDILVVPAHHPGDIVAVGHLKSSYIFSTRLEGVKLAMDRLIGGAGTFSGRPALAGLYGDLDARQDLLGIVTNDDGQMRRFLQQMAAAQDPNEGGPRITPGFIDETVATVDRLGWEMDVLSQDEISLRLLLQCRGPAEAQRVRAFLEQIGRESKQAGLAEPSPPRAKGAVVEASFRVARLQRIIGGLAGSPTPSTDVNTR